MPEILLDETEKSLYSFMNVKEDAFQITKYKNFYFSPSEKVSGKEVLRYSG